MSYSSDTYINRDSEGFEISPLSGCFYSPDTPKPNQSLDSRVLNKDLLEEKSELNQNIKGLFDDINILEEILIRTGIIIGTFAAVCGAVEIVRHYHLADYFR